jgi:hypothetical protein
VCSLRIVMPAARSMATASPAVSVRSLILPLTFG